MQGGILGEREVGAPEVSAGRKLYLGWCFRLSFNRGPGWRAFLALMAGAVLYVCPAQALTCSTSDVQTEAWRQVLAAQGSLLAVTVAAMETDVPDAAQVGLVNLKEALARAVDAEVACHRGSDAELERTLAEVLRANQLDKSVAPAKSGGSGEDPLAGQYGGELKIHVTRPKEAPDMLAVDVGFEIACGNDQMLLLYERRDEQWTRVLRWQSPRYRAISGAFGGFFLFEVLSGGEQARRVVVAHGTDWCLSRFSSGVIDVLRLQPGRDAPEVLWHTSRMLSRSDYLPRLKAAGKEFEVRWNAPATDVSGYERTVVYHYRVEGRSLIRLAPVAVNGRGFVEEWLEMPWVEAKMQTASESRARMQMFHERYEQAEKSTDSYVSYDYGPVKACAGAKEFQVEMDAKGKGGSDRPVYFRLREGGNGYVMVGESSRSDAQCTGPDLLPLKR